MNGYVDAGDGGIHASGNLNIAAVFVLNAANIQVGGKVTGVPPVEAPNIGGLTAANNVAGSAAKIDLPGYGGDSGDAPDSRTEKTLPLRTTSGATTSRAAFKLSAQVR
jgi:hypothetical protein